MSTPISAIMHSAARLPTPVMVSSRSRAWANGLITRSSPHCGVPVRTSGMVTHIRWSF
jgi:hypothetical protein